MMDQYSSPNDRTDRPDWMDPAMEFMDYIFGPQGDSVERFITIQRIQDVAVLFSGGHDLINPMHNFGREPGLRHIGMWNGADAYRAVAGWMLLVGPRGYTHYLRDIKDTYGVFALHQLQKRTIDWNDQYLPQTSSPDSQVSGSRTSHATPSALSPPQRTPGPENEACQPPGPQPLIDYNAEVHQLMEQNGQDWRGIIATYEQYQGYMAAYKSIPNQIPEVGVQAMPQHDRDFLPFVRRVYSALVDCSDLIENPRLVPQSKKRKLSGHGNERQRGEEQEPEFVDCVAVSRTKELKSLEVELLSWQIVEEAFYQQQGKYDIPPWWNQPKPGKPSTCKRPGTYVSFEARVAKCEEALRSSKNIVKQMLDIGFAKRLVYNPHAEVNRKKENKKVNSKRDEENKAGKYAKAAGLIIIDESDRSIKTATGEQVAPAHPLAARMAEEVNSMFDNHEELEGAHSTARSTQYAMMPAQAPQVVQASSSAAYKHLTHLPNVASGAFDYTGDCAPGPQDMTTAASQIVRSQPAADYSIGNAFYTLNRSSHEQGIASDFYNPRGPMMPAAIATALARAAIEPTGPPI